MDTDQLLPQDSTGHLEVLIANCYREQDRDSTFRPLDITDRERLAQPLLPTPVSLFYDHLSESLVNGWVNYTNAGPVPGPQGPPTAHTHQNKWVKLSIKYTSSLQS